MKDPSSDIAVLAAKGSLLVRREREKAAAIKGQKKEWNLEGTQIGKVMGVEKKKEPKSDEAHGKRASLGGVVCIDLVSFSLLLLRVLLFSSPPYISFFSLLHYSCVSLSFSSPCSSLSFSFLSF